VRSALERLRQIGCRIALDDFGTGYSSLAYITRFPPDRIKIDKAFVNNVDRSASDAAVANAILSLGKSLNLVVTAEGSSAPVKWNGCARAAATRCRASCSRGRCPRATWRTATSLAQGGLRNARRESAQRRILDQVQNAREKMVVGFGAADVNDGGAR